MLRSMAHSDHDAEHPEGSSREPGTGPRGPGRREDRTERWKGIDATLERMGECGLLWRSALVENARLTKLLAADLVELASAALVPDANGEPRLVVPWTADCVERGTRDSSVAARNDAERSGAAAGSTMMEWDDIITPQELLDRLRRVIHRRIATLPDASPDGQCVFWRMAAWDELRDRLGHPRRMEEKEFVDAFHESLWRLPPEHALGLADSLRGALFECYQRSSRPKQGLVTPESEHEWSETKGEPHESNLICDAFSNLGASLHQRLAPVLDGNPLTAWRERLVRHVRDALFAEMVPSLIRRVDGPDVEVSHSISGYEIMGFFRDDRSEVIKSSASASAIGWRE